MTATTKTNIPGSVETMFTDPQPWKRLKSGMYLYYNNTTQIGITLATKSPRYNSLALNKGDSERLIAAKRDGKIKEAYVVAAKLNPGEPPTYLGAELAEVVVARLERRPTIDGKIHGPFWVLEEGEIDDEDDEF